LVQFRPPSELDIHIGMLDSARCLRILICMFKVHIALAIVYVQPSLS